MVMPWTINGDVNMAAGENPSQESVPGIKEHGSANWKDNLEDNVLQVRSSLFDEAQIPGTLS